MNTKGVKRVFVTLMVITMLIGTASVVNARTRIPNHGVIIGVRGGYGFSALRNAGTATELRETVVRAVEPRYIVTGQAVHNGILRTVSSIGIDNIRRGVGFQGRNLVVTHYVVNTGVMFSAPLICE